MKYNVVNLDSKKVSQIDLDDRVWGCEVRRDIISRVVRWQLSKRRQGTHSTKTVSQVSGTTKKPFRQKGTGNARQGSLRSVQMRGGAVAHGPVDRSHAHKLQKKVRSLGLRSVLSDKVQSSNLVITDSLDLKEPKTSYAKNVISSLSDASTLVIVPLDASGSNFIRSVANLPNVNCLSVAGLNVYDIVRHEKVIITNSAVVEIEERL